jgi:hypothetical protein
MLFGKAHQSAWSVLMVIISWVENLNGGGLSLHGKNTDCVCDRALRGIFGPQKEETTGICKKELHSLYFSRNFITMPKARKVI